MEEIGFCVHKIGPKRSPKVKSVMALCLKILFMSCKNYVQSFKGYPLAIDGLYQGMYDSYIDVIGDKMGGDTSVVYFTDPSEFEYHLNKLHSIANIPFKVFHVIQNPFDNIVTIALYKHIKFRVDKIAMIKSINETLRLYPEQIAI